MGDVIDITERLRERRLDEIEQHYYEELEGRETGYGRITSVQGLPATLSKAGDSVTIYDYVVARLTDNFVARSGTIRVDQPEAPETR